MIFLVQFGDKERERKDHKRNDTRSGTHRDRTDARANDSNQICGQERQACMSGGNDGFALESTS